MANSNATSSIVVGIIAIVAVFAVAYFALMFFNTQPASNDTGTTAGIDVDVGTTGGTPPPYAP